MKNDMTGFAISGSEYRGATEYVGTAGNMVISGHNNQTSDQRLLDFKTIVSRPYVAVEGVLPINSVAMLYQVDIWSLFIGSPYRALFNWFGGVRFTTHLRLVVTNTPQISGMVAISHLPLGGVGTVNRQAYNSAVAQLPHVRLNLNVENEAVLCVPWDSLLEFLPLDDAVVLTADEKKMANGTVAINMLNPIRSTDATTPSYTLFVSFHDIQVFGEKPILVTYSQSGDPIEVERPRPSTALRHGSVLLKTVSDMTSRFLPSISAIARPASWVLDVASRAATSFGYSKPQVIGAPNRVINFTGGFEHIADVEDYSLALSLTQDNRVIPDLTISTDVDEMSLDYLLTRPGALDRVQYSTSFAIGRTIMRSPTCPTFFAWLDSAVPDPRSLGSGTTNVSFFPTPLGYVAQFFDLWRGDLVYTLTVSRTPFHAGKLLVGWVPVGGESTLPVVNTSYYGPASNSYPYLSKIWDIKSESTIEFRVPYIAPVPFLATSAKSGNFFLRVLEPLTCPPNVPTSVDIFVEVRAADGFEVAVPRDPCMYCPVTGTTALSRTVAQSGGDLTCPLVDGNPLQPTPSSVEVQGDAQTAQICIGEHVKSVKQLIMRASVWTYTTTDDFTVNPPWRIMSTLYNFAAATGGATKSVEAGYLNMVAWMYAYAAGGFCVDTWTNANRSDDTFLSYWDTPFTTFDSVANTTHFERLSQGVNSPMVTAANGGLRVGGMHVRVPYYSSLRRMPVQLSSDGNLYTFINKIGAKQAPILIHSTTATGNTGFYASRLSRRASDDFRFSRFLGAPLCAYYIAAGPQPFYFSGVGDVASAFDVDITPPAVAVAAPTQTLVDSFTPPEAQPSD